MISRWAVALLFPLLIEVTDIVWETLGTGKCSQEAIKPSGGKGSTSDGMPSSHNTSNTSTNPSGCFQLADIDVVVEDIFLRDTISGTS